jgi:hypothetical protein
VLTFTFHLNPDLLGFSEWYLSTLFDASLFKLQAAFLRGFFFGPELALYLSEQLILTIGPSATMVKM